ncbi:MAG TPA: pitrilysin family protein [Gemmatimonadaceae bacterium]|nr:pitrilysin family protein [Gemmatimonadaceae bacterium]
MSAFATKDEVGLRRSVLANGLTVLSEHMPGVRSVALGAWVRAATLHEKPGVMGVSHMLEHMVFKGTPTRSAKDLALSLETLGGSLDAYTSREHTCYQARVLDEHAAIAADVLADLIFRPLLKQSDLDLERKVVLEEINTVDDTPDDLVFELHGAELWGDHPHGYPILGTRETVGALTPGDLKSLHERAYHPGNVVVAASGNIDHDDLLEILHSTGWAEIPPSSERPEAPPAPIPSPAAKRHFHRDSAQTHIVFGSATVRHDDPRRHALSLVGMLLGGGMSSRLFQKVREDLALAYSVYTFQSFHRDSGNHGIYVGTAPETAKDAGKAIFEELARLSAEGIGEEELAAGKSQLKGQITLSLESVSSRMYRAAGVELYDEEYRTLDELLAIVDGISGENVMQVCRDFFSPDSQTVVSLGPRPAF